MESCNIVEHRGLLYLESFPDVLYTTEDIRRGGEGGMEGRKKDGEKEKEERIMSIRTQ